MAKSYNLNSKSDMKKFMKSLENSVKAQSKNALKNRLYDIQCPHCQSKIKVRPGKSPCPVCRKAVTLTLDIKH